MRNHIMRASAIIGGLAFTMPARAQQSLDIGEVSGGNEGTTAFTAFLQTWVNFATGPWAVAVVAISIIVGVVIWMLMPREGWLGWVMRGLIGGLILMNLATWMADLGFIATT